MKENTVDNIITIVVPIILIAILVAGVHFLLKDEPAERSLTFSVSSHEETELEILERKVETLAGQALFGEEPEGSKCVVSFQEEETTAFYDSFGIVFERSPAKWERTCTITTVETIIE